jgi:hypothetical protein
MKVNPGDMTDCQYRKMTSKKDKKRVRVNVMFTNWMLSAEGGATLASLGHAVGARSLRGGVLGHAERWPGK